MSNELRLLSYRRILNRRLLTESICALPIVNVDHLVIFLNDITRSVVDPRNSPRMESVYEKRIMLGTRAGEMHPTAVFAASWLDPNLLALLAGQKGYDQLPKANASPLLYLSHSVASLSPVEPRFVFNGLHKVSPA